MGVERTREVVAQSAMPAVEKTEGGVGYPEVPRAALTAAWLGVETAVDMAVARAAAQRAASGAVTAVV